MEIFCYLYNYTLLFSFPSTGSDIDRFKYRRDFANLISSLTDKKWSPKYGGVIHHGPDNDCILN